MSLCNCFGSIKYRVIKENADDAFYELQNPKEQIQAYVFDVVRAHVPRMTLDELFEQKGDVAQAVLEELENVMGAYGYNIEHILMVDIIPDPSRWGWRGKINLHGKSHQSWHCKLVPWWELSRWVC
ncbi:Hypersensitive-induced response protein 4 [Camellia lanceoleosa]|nr:Hypersensitive-induced response protein 4 [Camellia lanceoleosa]